MGLSDASTLTVGVHPNIELSNKPIHVIYAMGAIFFIQNLMFLLAIILII
tara:strand:- start:11 stop:160 length:150 start_codon:yes stop_codon:yes gene_type:complete